MKRMPIKAAKDVADKYKQDQVILITWSKESGLAYVVTYGKTLKDCDQAAQCGNFIKKAFNFPEESCNSVPARMRRKIKKAENKQEGV